MLLKSVKHCCESLVLLSFCLLSFGLGIAFCTDEVSNSTTRVTTKSNVTVDFLTPDVKFNIIVEDRILCRDCGRDITTAENFASILSPERALSSTNGTILGQKFVTVQKFRNPAGIDFNIITVSNSSCVGHGEWILKDTWFPGYAWRVCVCPHCSSHKGWMFEPASNVRTPEEPATGKGTENETGNGEEEATGFRRLRVHPSEPSKEGFYALIADSLVQEDFAESLLLTPKVLRY